MNLVSLCAFSVKKFEILDETNFEWNVSYLCIYNISWNENWKVCRLSVISINGLVAILASATIRLNSDAVWDQHQGSINSPVFSHLNLFLKENWHKKQFVYSFPLPPPALYHWKESINPKKRTKHFIEFPLK